MIKKLLGSLRAQISIYYLLGSLVTVSLIGFILYFSISGIVLDETLKATTMAVDKSGKHIEGYIDKIKDLSLIIAGNPSLIRYLEGEGDDAAGDGEDIHTLIDQVLETDSSILSVIIVGKEGQLVSNEAALDMSMSDDMMQEAWYKAVVDSDGMPSLTSARMQKFSMDKDQWVISLSREIRSEDGRHLGVVLVDFSYSIIETYLSDLNLGTEGYVFILNGDGGVVYHKDTDYFQNQQGQQELKKLASMEPGYESAMNLLFHSCGIPGTDWQMYGITSLDSLNAIRRQLVETIVVAILAMLVTLLVFGTFVAGKITRPISRLEDAMKDVEEGLKLIELDERGCNEVVSLSVHYNQMIERIRLLMAEIGEKEQAIRAYELNVLHSQINPHFLYNTLDTIVWMAEFGDSEKVIYITKALARFFRLSLSGGSERTTIGNELDHVRQYLMIQKERYGDQLDYKIDSVTDLDEVVIPKIILQPIVENSIYHGIRDMDGPGLVSVEVRNEENAIVFIVKDNGVGFDPESEVENSKEGKTRLGGVGIRNVDERIKLTYGQKYGLTLNSAPGKGTEVVLRIPQGEKEQIDVK